MLKKLLIVGSLVIIGMLFFGTPLQTSDNPAAVVKKAGDSYKMKVVQDTTKKVTQDLGEQAIKQSCKNPNSQFCWTSQFTVFITSLAIAILFAGLFVAGVLAAIKFILSFQN